MHNVLKTLAVVSVLSGTVALAHAQPSEAPDPTAQTAGGMMDHENMMGMMKMMSQMSDMMTDCDRMMATMMQTKGSGAGSKG